MVIDIVVAAVVLLYAALSYWRGLLRWLAGIGAMVIASVASGFVGREAATYATAKWKWDITPAVAYAICCVLAWVVIFIVSRIILRAIAKALGSDAGGTPKPWNRKLGGLCGALVALAVCWFAVGIMDAIPEDIRAQRMPGLHKQLGNSAFTVWVVRPISPAAHLELQPLIADATIVANHPQALQGAEQKQELQKLAAHPKVTAVLGDGKLMEDLKAGRYTSFFSDRKVRDALEDRELRQMMRDLPVREILHEAAERARQQKG